MRGVHRGKNSRRFNSPYAELIDNQIYAKCGFTLERKYVQAAFIFKACIASLQITYEHVIKLAEVWPQQATFINRREIIQLLDKVLLKLDLPFPENFSEGVAIYALDLAAVGTN